MKRTLVAAVAFVWFLQSREARPTIHFIFWTGHDLYIASDSLRTHENTLPPEHVCKQVYGAGIIAVSWGITGNEIIDGTGHRIHLRDYPLVLQSILQGPGNAQKKYERAVAAAQEALLPIVLRQSQQLGAPKSHFVIGSALMWVKAGRPYMHTFEVSVEDWEAHRLAVKKEPLLSGMLINKVYMYPYSVSRLGGGMTETFAETIKHVPLLGATGMLDIATQAMSSSVGPPYSVMIIHPDGTTERPLANDPCKVW